MERFVGIQRLMVGLFVGVIAGFLAWAVMTITSSTYATVGLLGVIALSVIGGVLGVWRYRARAADGD